VRSPAGSAKSERSHTRPDFLIEHNIRHINIEHDRKFIHSVKHWFQYQFDLHGSGNRDGRSRTTGNGSV